MLHKIIIVDDEPMICKLLSDFLEALKYEIVVFNGGAACVRYLQDGGEADLIISDMRMPDGDGMTILNYLNTSQQKTPLFFMTGFSDIKHSEMLAKGARKVLTKPFKCKDLVDDIKLVLNEQVAK